MFDKFDQILPVFFAAMREGYATENPEKSTFNEFPGSKVITFEKEGFIVKDCYFSSKQMGELSFGQTVIFYEGVPVWVMSYQGWYAKSVIPLLKSALWENYGAREEGIFFGGRGPDTFLSKEKRFEGLVYLNKLNSLNDWKIFWGKEDIVDQINSRSMGWHKYQGMLMVPMPGKFPYPC